MSALSLRNVGKTYGDQVILEGVNVELQDGDFCAIVGASGSGKSTLLRILLGQEVASSGEILLDDVPLQSEPGPERGIVYQRYSVFPHMSVLANVTFGLEIQNGDALTGRVWNRALKLKLRKQAEQMLEAVGLSAVADRYPAQLSGGMQQRLAIAQALVVEPPLLLLDEPFAALDPGNRSSAQALLAQLWTEHKMTVVMVTHDLSEAFTLGTRVLVLDKLRQDPHEPSRYGATLTYDVPTQRAAAYLKVVSPAYVDSGTQTIEGDRIYA